MRAADIDLAELEPILAALTRLKGALERHRSHCGRSVSETFQNQDKIAAAGRSGRSLISL